MSIFTILETILIGPLKLVFEIIFSIANRVIGHPGLAIIVLSLTMNFLVLPLYRRADAMQEEARDVDAKLRDGITHIKKTFSGDERMMILQTYYRQNHYSPLSALNGSVSLLLEIPFFMAAYQFLSNLDSLNGVSFGPIADMGAPDGLLVMGGLTLNLLPMLMTLINVISSALYLKGFPLKTKIQLYAMAAFFLVFLYDSPACLVFYWTLNNVFSLIKTIFYKLRNPQKILIFLSSATGLGILLYGLFWFGSPSLKGRLFVLALGMLLQVPAVLPSIKKWIPQPKEAPKPDTKLFLISALFLTVLTGLFIPGNFIAASPQEYVDVHYFFHPVWYVVNAASLAMGTFLVWMGVFYWLATPRGKVLFGRLMWALCGVMLMNYMFFGTDLGVISPSLQYVEYPNGLYFQVKEQIINMGAILLLAAILYMAAVKYPKQVVFVVLTATIAMVSMSGLHLKTIGDSVNALNLEAAQNKEKPKIELSKDGQNVIVLFLDRAIGEYIPYFMQESPELKEQYSGFTYYSNVISYSGFTNYAAPPLFGGYEYTPVEMNRRDGEALVDKHNEALKVMPVSFLEAGFQVTVCDPPYANYQWIPDLSIYDDYPQIKAYNTEGFFGETEQKIASVASRKRNFFCFGLMKTMPLAVQGILYDSGRYNQSGADLASIKYGSQVIDGVGKATGIFEHFTDSYDVLVKLPEITNITSSGENNFLIFGNNTTHEPMLLQVPEYVPQQVVDNTAYDAAHADRFTYNGRTLAMDTSTQMMHYQCNMAVLKQLGNWFDYMREQNVYDNTRIIIVSDHGRFLQHNVDRYLEACDDNNDLSTYYPLLMVKDFNSQEFQMSDEFMTNADVPFLAMDGVISTPRNPFTGKEITTSEKNTHPQYIAMNVEWQVSVNNGNTFLPSTWISVENNIWDLKNWKAYEQSVVLTEHAAP